MMVRTNKFTPFRSPGLFLILSAIGIIGVVPSHAIGQEVTVFLKADFKPSKIEGLVTTTNGVTEKVNPTVREIKPQYYAVSFPLDMRKQQQERMATAVALGDEGQMAVGTVIYAEPDPGGNTCPVNVIDPVTMQVDAGTIRALAANRLKRRDHNRKIFEISFAQFPSSEIENAERNFGLYYPDRDEKDRNPFHMVDRLSRLLVALNSWKIRREATIPATRPTTPEGEAAPQTGSVPTPPSEQAK